MNKELIDKVIEQLETTTKSQLNIATELGISQGTVCNIGRKNNVVRPMKELQTKEIKSIDPTDERVLSLERKVISLQDERNSLKAAYKASQRESGIFQALAEEIKIAVTPVTPLPVTSKINYYGKKIKESLVLCLSDEHACDIVLPHQVGGLENYNFPIALRRAETLIDAIIKFTKKILKSYQFDTLYILALGDHVSGEIHNAVDHSEYKNIFRNCIATGQMHALMVRDLASHFDNVKVIGVSGNHGRKSLKKDYHGPRDNWDYLIHETAAAYCRDLINVEFIIPDSYSACVEIENHGFLVSHGDDVKSWNSIPFYGIERKTRRLAALNNATGQRIDNYIFGHFHNIADIASLKGEVIINGAWPATSPFVYNAMSTFNEPAQLLFGVHRDYGISWRLPIKLKTIGEEQGPQRYSIIMAK